MRPSFYQEKWERLKDSPSTPELESLSQRVASTFIDRYFYSDEYNRSYIDLLCDMATHYSDPELNQVAARALFGIVIERLCDDFEELQTETYNRLISQVISYLRNLADGKELDIELNSFGLQNEEQLYQRIEAIRLSPDIKLPSSLQPKKILILSRITIGADVAITSVICQRMASMFPDAAIAVIGNAKLGQVFSTQSKVGIHELHYARRGGLLERFLVWTDLLKQIRDELSGLSAEEYLVLDPDSRLTQLGVLPLVPMQNYRFFNSRGKQDYPAKATISELTNLWLDNILGQGDFCYPKIWPDSDSIKSALQMRKTIQNKNLISINLGVGGNPRKRVDGSFEVELLLTLLKEKDVFIMLDLGFGSEERARSEAILTAAKEHGHISQELEFAKLGEASTDCQLLGIECSVAEIASLIAISDEFIGYDSACQHIAAAEGVPTYTIFAGTNNVRFIRRWHACGPDISEIIYVDTLSKYEEIDNSEIVARLIDLRKSRRAN